MRFISIAIISVFGSNSVGFVDASSPHSNIKTNCGVDSNAANLTGLEEVLKGTGLKDVEIDIACHIAHRASSTSPTPLSDPTSLIGDLKYRIAVRADYEQKARHTSSYCRAPSRYIDENVLKQFEDIASKPGQVGGGPVKRDLNRAFVVDFCRLLRLVDRNEAEKNEVVSNLGRMQSRLSNFVTKEGFQSWKRLLKGETGRNV